MSECGASLAELRKDGNFSEKVRYRGSLITKRCDCRNSNGLDPVCKCTYKPPAPKSKATRSEASVSAAAPAPRRMFAKTTQPPIPNFKVISPPAAVNLNGDTIAIPERYKYRRFQAAADPNSQLHWMVRPETPPKSASSPNNYHKFEETVPHHRRTPMMPGTDENVVRSSLMTETAQHQQQFQAEKPDNFHEPEVNARNFQADSSTCSGNPSHEANYMYRTKRRYDYDQTKNQSRQNYDEVRPAPPPQESVRSQEASAHPSQEREPAAHPTPEPVPRSTQESHPVQTQVPASNSVHVTHPAQQEVPTSYSAQETASAQPSHAPVATSQCAKESIQQPHPYHEPMPAPTSVPVSVPTATRVPPREAAPTPVENRPATPMPAQDSFAQVLDAASAGDSVAAPKTTVPSQVPHPQPEQRDRTLCPDRIYSHAH